MDLMLITTCLLTLSGPPICSDEAVINAAYVCDINGCFDRGIVGGPGRYTYPGYQVDQAWRYSGGRPRWQGDDYYRFRYGPERRQDRRMYRRNDYPDWN